MGQEGIAFWSAATIPALGPFFVNWVVRGKDVLKSSGADFLLLLLAFDLTAAIAHEELRDKIPSDVLKAGIQPLAVGSVMLTLVFWLIVVKYLEPLAMSHHPTSWRTTAKQLLGLLVVWSVIAMLTMCHIYIFFYKSTS